MTIHEIKCDQRFFGAIADGTKPFEVRWNDRDYKAEDMLLIHETRMEASPRHADMARRVLTGRSVQRRVTYVLKHEDFPEGVPEGWCVLGLSDRAAR
jgi:hypothetical protein